MDFENVNLLTHAAFRGGLRVVELQRSRSQAPDCPGVYLIVRKNNSIPQFVERGTGGYFRGKNPNVDTSKLKQRWIRQAKVIYIGKASTSLRQRINCYMRFGSGRPCAHYGGRHIWQLADSGQLLVFWKQIKNGMAATEEKRLLRKFSERYGCLPFANLRH